MKHKHSEIIKAFVDGVECEWFDSLNNKWQLIKELKEFDWGVGNVRIKPDPIKEQESQYLYVYQDRGNNISVYHTMMAESYNNWFYMGKVRVEK